MKVSVVLPFNGIVAAPKAFEIVGGGTTVTVAVLLVAPTPLSVELIVLVVLFFTPPVVPVTLTAIVQLPLVANDPPDRLIEPEPATAVTVPPQTPLKPFGVATTSPAGNVSLNAMPLSDVLAFGLLIVNVNKVEPLSGIVAAPKALLIVGGAATFNVAEAVKPAPPCVEETTPVVLSFEPAVVPLTTTLIEQLPPAVAIEPPVSEMLVLPADGANVPPQVFVVPGVVSTSIPAGKASLTATPVTPAGLAAGLVMVRVIVDVPPT